MGRETYEVLSLDDPLYGHLYADTQLVVVTRTLRSEQHPHVMMVPDQLGARLDRLRAQPGKNIWLFRRGELFRTPPGTELCHTVELAAVPGLPGGGVPFLPAPRRLLEPTGQQLDWRSGIVLLSYGVVRPVD